MHRWWLSCTCLFVLNVPIYAQVPADDLANLQGKWNCIGGNLGGKPLDKAQAAAKGMTFIIKDDKLLSFEKGQPKGVYSFRLNPTLIPRELDTIELEGKDSGRKGRGIYELDGDVLKICLRDKVNGRPGKFEVPEGVDDVYLILERDAPLAFRNSLTTRILGYTISPVIRAAIVDGRKKNR